MVEEIYETKVGFFRVVGHPEKDNLVQVQTFLQNNESYSWEDIGFMKRKDFYNFINKYNPKRCDK